MPFPLSLMNHEWILTDTIERGMGGANGDVPARDGNKDLPYSSTQINDHTGQSLAADAKCDKVENVDEQCVNMALELGRATGRFSLWNNCQTTVTEILIQCSIKDPDGNNILD